MNGAVQDVMGVFGLQRKRELADMLGVTPSAVSRWEERGLSPDAWRKIQIAARDKGLKLPDSFYATVSDAPQDEAAA